MTALTLASLITLSSNAKGYIHPCGFRPHWFAFMKALSPFLCRLPSLCAHGVSSAFTRRTLGQVLLDCFLGYFTIGEGLRYQSNSEDSFGASGWKEADQVDMTQYIQCCVNFTQALTSNCAPQASPLLCIHALKICRDIPHLPFFSHSESNMYVACTSIHFPLMAPSKVSAQR